MERADGTGSANVVTEVEGGNVHRVRRISETHFSIEMKPDFPSTYEYPNHHSYWFYFKMEGVQGKEITIDMTNCDWMPSHWRYYKPVYSYAKDPDRLSGVRWHKIEKTLLQKRTFSFVQAFEKDAVWVALRYPYSYKRERRLVEKIGENNYVKVENLGVTGLGNPLLMVLITDQRVSSDQTKGVLVYAREHGVEQDGSWVAEGMIDFLLSAETPAEKLRRYLVFMIVPIISPDSVILGRAVDPATGTLPGRELAKENMNSTEAKVLYNRVQRLVDDGTPLDISVSFHNPHGTEPNLYPNYLPDRDPVRLRKAKRLHRSIVRYASGYTLWKERTLGLGAYSVGRFAGDFDSTAILYEVNHQAANNYLSVEKLKGMGEVILKGIADYYELGS